MAKDRDKELEDLDEVERGLKAKPRPFIERPAQLDTGKGALCWGDGTRLCGPDCVAFNAEQGLDANGLPVDSPNKCLILLYSGQQGSAALSQVALNRSLLKKVQDEARTAVTGNPPPPAVAMPGGNKR